MTDIDIPALKAAALESIAERERGPQRIDRLHFITLVDEHAVFALIERLERAEAVAEYARSREIPTTEKQVKAAEMFFTAPMMARLEKLEAVATAARVLLDNESNIIARSDMREALAALEAP